MRALLIAMAIGAASAAVTGCTAADPNSPAMQAMINPPNACGPGGTPDINSCSSSSR